MANQIENGDDYQKQVKKKLTDCGLFTSTHEDAADLFDKAANAFKLAKSCEQAGVQYLKLAHCHLKSDSQHEAASAYADAGHCYKKIDAKEVDQSVQELLTMMEDGDSSLGDADLIHLKRSDMFDRIKQTYHKHQTLAEQYDLFLSSNYSSLTIKDVHEWALNELELEKERVAVLQQQVVELESRVSKCNFRLFGLEIDLSCSKEELAKMKDELSYARECFEMEKSDLQTKAQELSDLLFSAWETNQEIEIEVENLRNEVKVRKMDKGELIKSLKSAKEEIKIMMDELAESCRVIETLEYNVLLKEKEKDIGEISSGEKKIGELEEDSEMTGGEL